MFHLQGVQITGENLNFYPKKIFSSYYYMLLYKG